MARERNEGNVGLENRYAGYTVYDAHYEKIGKVDDLFLDENDNPEYVGVKMGFLGTRSTLIPIELVRFNDRRQLVEVAAEKDAVKEGPTFDDDREITAEFERRVLDYYRVERAQVSTEYGEPGAYGAYYPGAARDERVDLRPGERTGTHERLDESQEAGTTAGTGRGVESGTGGREGEDEIRVQRIEEELRAGTRQREAGGVNVRKRVRTDRERLSVPRKREEVSVERVPVEEGRASTEPEIGEDEIRVPVIEEEIVVERRPIVKEEIRLRKEVVEEEEVVEADVRKEEVDVEDHTERRRGSDA